MLSRLRRSERGKSKPTLGSNAEPTFLDKGLEAGWNASLVVDRMKECSKIPPPVRLLAHLRRDPLGQLNLAKIDRMRILFAAPGYKPAYRLGGSVQSVTELAEALVRRGHEVMVFATNSNYDEDLDVPLDQAVDVDGVKVWYFRRREVFQRWIPFIPYLSKSMGFLYAPRMAAALRAVVPTVDVVHTHLPFTYPTYAAAKAAGEYKKPLFYHQHGNLNPVQLAFRSVKKEIYLRFVERLIMKQATALVALTPVEVESFRAQGVERPCHIIPNGVDPSKYRTEPSGDALRGWGIPDNRMVVLFLGRLHPIKGADRLLEAFIRIRDRVPETILVLAGPDEWGIQAKYQETVRRAGVQDRVLFPGMVTGEDKLDLLARANLFCLPSSGEGFSMAVLEALASGTPVLLSPLCHFPEVEAAGVGRLAPVEPDALGAMMVELLQRPRDLEKMGRQGLEFVSRHYGWDRIVDRLLEVYREGLGRNGS